MERIRFTSNDWPSLGVELEFPLVDLNTMGLTSSYDAVFDRVPESIRPQVKPELMQCYLEVNTKVCRTVREVETDLRRTIKGVETAAAEQGVGLLWSATHPFSLWHEQKISQQERDLSLVELLQETARRLVVFGMHVHVGVDSGDKAVMIADRILRHLPALLALSANSPFWSGRNTGLHSQRSKVMNDLPSAGLPPLMRNWSEYLWLVRHLVRTGFIKTIREVWWDVRPHHNFGTIEIRICDMPRDLHTVLAITALIQCLVHALSEEIDRGTYQHDCHPMMVRLNKWRACRHGLGASLVDPYTEESLPARQVVRKLVSILSGVARELECSDYLETVLALTERPSGSDAQLELAQATNMDLRAMVARQVSSALGLAIRTGRGKCVVSPELHQIHTLARHVVAMLSSSRGSRLDRGVRAHSWPSRRS